MNETEPRRRNIEATEPDFTTERLRVWCVCGRYQADGMQADNLRMMFIANVKDRDWPGVAVSASIQIDHENPRRHLVVDWVQTADAMRGNSYAEELLFAIEDHMHNGEPLQAYPVTTSGKKLAYRMGWLDNLELDADMNLILN